MNPWTAGPVQEALGLRRCPASGPWTGVSTDTRSIEPGALFVALVGERFDGHDYLAAARDQGATAAVVRRGTAAGAGPGAARGGAIRSAPTATSRVRGGA